MESMQKFLTDVEAWVHEVMADVQPGDDFVLSIIYQGKHITEIKKSQLTDTTMVLPQILIEALTKRNQLKTLSEVIPGRTWVPDQSTPALRQAALRALANTGMSASMEVEVDANTPTPDYSSITRDLSN